MAKKTHLFDFQEYPEEENQEKTVIEKSQDIDYVELDFDDDLSVSDSEEVESIGEKKDELEEAQEISSSDVKDSIEESDFEDQNITEDLPENGSDTIEKSHVTSSSKKNKINLKSIKDNPRVTRALEDLKNSFKGLLSKTLIFLESKGIRLDKKSISFHVNNSIRTIVILVLSIIGLTQSFSTFAAIDKLDLIEEHYRLKKEIKIEEEKIKANINAEYLADILKFGVKTENGRYPENGYLEAFNEIFPENVSDLQLLTFLEGWGSEFIDYNGKKIRVDNDLIKTFQQQNNVVNNGLLSGYKYKIILEGSPEKIDNVLYNLRYSNKIPKFFSKINKKYNSSKGVLTVELDVIFYLSK